MSFSYEEVKQAYERIRPYIRKTPLEQSFYLGDEIRNYFFKLESCQRAKSFKIRGALNKMMTLTDEEKQKGVATISSGNHGSSVSYAASLLGIENAKIIVPETTPKSKVDKIKYFGAEVMLMGKNYDEAHARGMAYIEEHGMTYIDAYYDDPKIYGGQGTIAIELLEQNPDLDTIVVPIGGGGLASGVASAVKMLHPNVRVIGVQAAGAAGMKASIEAGHVVSLDTAKTIADGIAVKKPGDLTFALCQQYVDEIVTVSEDEIAAAILALMENQKLVAEGAGATPVAAALFGKLPLAGKKTVCLISGGNIDVNILSRVITRGLVMSGRKTNLMIALEDKPGQLSLVSDIVSACGANVVSVHHDRSDANMAITSCFLKLGLETRDAVQIETIKQKLTEAGFKLVTERA